MDNRKIDQLLILTNTTETYTHNRIVQSATSLGVDVNCWTLQELTIELSSQNLLQSPHLVLPRSSGVMFDDFDLALLRTLEQQGHQVVNGASFIGAHRNKSHQQAQLIGHELPTIAGLLHRGKPNEQTKKALTKLSPNQHFILKTERGNGGIGVCPISGLDSLLSLLERQWAQGDQKYLIQPRLNFVKEWRLLLMPSGERFLMEKMGTELIKNASRGCEFVPCPNPEVQVKDLVERLSSLYSGKFIAFDLALEGNQQKLYVIELNCCPGFKEVEKNFKVDIPKLLISQTLI